MPIPGGEAIAAVQLRVLATLAELERHHHGGPVAVFTHRDVIRLAVAGLVGIPIADLDSLEAGYASVTEIAGADPRSSARLPLDTNDGILPLTLT